MIEKILARAIRETAQKAVPLIVSGGTVSSIDKDKRTCDVDRDGLPSLSDVCLNANEAPGADLVTIFPKVGSFVLCIIVENQQADAYVLTATDIEEVNISIASMTVQVNEDGITFNGGEIGGLAKVSELVDRLNLLETKINDFITAIGSWVPVASDGGAALKTAITSWVSESLEKTKVEDIENTKIKQ